MLLPPASCRRIAVTATLALHACAVVGVLALQPASAPEISAPQPIAVQWIEPPRIEPPKPQPAPPPPPKAPPPSRKAEPKPTPPKPEVVQPQPVPQLAAAEAPPIPEAPVVEPPPPAPAAEAPAAPAAPPAPPAPAAPAPAPAAPAPIAPPRFDAAYLNNPPPAYPPQARRRGESGRVVLRVLVAANGLPERVELRTSSGSEILDGAALQAVRRWKFVPARQGDTPVSAWVLVPIHFTLEG